jgi:hypothetical protein
VWERVACGTRSRRRCSVQTPARKRALPMLHRAASGRPRTVALRGDASRRGTPLCGARRRPSLGAVRARAHGARRWDEQDVIRLTGEADRCLTPAYSDV